MRTWAITLHRNNLRRNSPCSATLWMSCYAFKVASFLMSSFLDPRNYYWRHQCCRDPGTSAAMIIVSLSSLQPGSWITLSLNYNILILRSSRLLRSRNLAAINLCKFTAKFLDPYTWCHPYGRGRGRPRGWVRSSRKKCFPPGRVIALGSACRREQLFLGLSPQHG